jgi:hypothetical protein
MSPPRPASTMCSPSKGIGSVHGTPDPRGPRLPRLCPRGSAPPGPRGWRNAGLRIARIVSGEGPSCHVRQARRRRGIDAPLHTQGAEGAMPRRRTACGGLLGPISRGNTLSGRSSYERDNDSRQCPLSPFPANRQRLEHRSRRNKGGFVGGRSRVGAYATRLRWGDPPMGRAVGERVLAELLPHLLGPAFHARAESVPRGCAWTDRPRPTQAHVTTPRWAIVA